MASTLPFARVGGRGKGVRKKKAARLQGGCGFTTFAAIRRAKSRISDGIAVPGASALFFSGTSKEESMAWTTPVLVEICIGLEINGYMPADGYVPPEF